MTVKQLEFIKELLTRIKGPDEQVAKALSFVNKDLASFAARKGSLKDQYEYDERNF